jgi:hypothetical protein
MKKSLLIKSLLGVMAASASRNSMVAPKPSTPTTQTDPAPNWMDPVMLD